MQETKIVHPNSQRFYDLLEECKKLHDKKQRDYGRDNDPFSNVKASEDFGIKPWVGAMIRLNDKVRRLQQASKGINLSNESVEDSLQDIMVYAGIAYVLYTEQMKPYEGDL